MRYSLLRLSKRVIFQEREHTRTSIVKKVSIIGGFAVLAIFFLLLTYLVSGFVTLEVLNARYDNLRAGMTAKEVDEAMGWLFVAREIDVLPDGYSDIDTGELIGLIREYRLLGIKGLNIIVIYDRDGFSTLSIDCFE